MDTDPHGLVDERLYGGCGEGTWWRDREAEEVGVGVGEEARGVGEAEEVAWPPEEEARGGCARGGVGARGGLEERGSGRRNVRGDDAVGDQDGRRRHGRTPELLVRHHKWVVDDLSCLLEALAELREGRTRPRPAQILGRKKINY